MSLFIPILAAIEFLYLMAAITLCIRYRKESLTVFIIIVQFLLLSAVTTIILYTWFLFYHPEQLPFIIQIKFNKN